ncbi:MAG: hypothetical protein ACYTAS_11230 [Planctomycetota bacterium]|jgi:hypothetical protein
MRIVEYLNLRGIPMSQPSPFNSDALVAISGGDLKQAALFFERVLPLHSAGDVPSEVRFDQSGLLESDQFAAMMQESISTMRRLREVGQVAGSEEELAELGLHEFHNRLMRHYHSALTRASARSVPLFHSVSEFEGSLSQGEEEAIEIKLVRAPLIDTSGVEWDQVIDIRRDGDFTRKLRRFRLFINDNYQGKEPSYIRDSLLQKMEDYEDACRKHGLKLTVSTLSKVLNSRSLLGSLGLSATAILLGNPAVATAGVLSGAAIEIGKIYAFTLPKRRSNSIRHCGVRR